MPGQIEIDDCERDGHVVSQRLRLSRGERGALAEDLERVLANNPEVPHDRLVNSHPDRNPPHGLAGFAGFDALARAAHIPGMVEQAPGPDLILWRGPLT